MSTIKRIRELLILDGQGFRAEVQLLPEATFRDRVLELIDSVPEPGPDGVRVLQLACNGCNTKEPLSADDPQLPKGWITRDDGDFCPACAEAR